MWGRGLGEEWGRSQKAKLFGKEGTHKCIKTLLFTLKYRKKYAGIKMPREVKTSNLTDYIGQYQVAETSALAQANTPSQGYCPMHPNSPNLQFKILKAQ